MEKFIAMFDKEELSDLCSITDANLFQEVDEHSMFEGGKLSPGDKSDIDNESVESAFSESGSTCGNDFGSSPATRNSSSGNEGRRKRICGNTGVTNTFKYGLADRIYPTRNCKTDYVRLMSDNCYADFDGGRSMSKNAILARENRQKKKNYIANLEGSVKFLSAENNQLKKKMAQANDELSYMRQNIRYLQSVIKNDSALSRLLQNIPNTPEIRFVSPFFSSQSADVSTEEESVSKKRRCVDRSSSTNGVTSRQTINPKQVLEINDHDYGSAADVKRKVNATSAGVCLHVNNNAVSIELCDQCNKQATM